MKRLIEPYNLRWLEEAITLNDINGYHELRRFGTTRIAVGEHEFTSYGLHQMIEARALDYFQFDTNRVGGITAARKIQALAEAYSIPVVPHAASDRSHKGWGEHKLHAVTDANGRPLSLLMTAGRIGAADLLDDLHKAKWLLGDRG